MMQVCGCAGKSDIDIVATDFKGFIVERLVDVDDKVDDEAEGVVDFIRTQRGGNDTLSVICNGAATAKPKSLASVKAERRSCKLT